MCIIQLLQRVASSAFKFLSRNFTAMRLARKLGQVGQLLVGKRTMAATMQPLDAVKAMGLNGQWKIAAHERQIVEQMCDISTTDLLVQLLPEAQKLAQPIISGFYVGAVMLSDSGNVYFGANQEFDKAAINASVHAEQSAMCNLFHDGQRQVVALAVTAAPCGHCRQFLSESHKGSDITVNIADQPSLPLNQLLPHAFTPKDLGNEQPLLSHPRQKLEAAGSYTALTDNALNASTTTDLTLTKAVVAASFSYAPYSGAYSAIALGLKDGRVIEGRYIESVAFNPALPPAQAALIQLAVNGASPEDVVCAVLAEVTSEGPCVSHSDATASLFKRVLPPNVPLLYQPLKQKETKN
eukprot:TRINITY_DN9924_c0_g1_i1.p1 TRINITY_DN9924_c0_g1~~TRINITY_DN9924_c0_g1_i1.p1  ORF type:complete len:353 (+),score=40.09 TRINITY_DN9924_c0_g1_i1:248-1306(+)